MIYILNFFLLFIWKALGGIHLSINLKKYIKKISIIFINSKYIIHGLLKDLIDNCWKEYINYKYTLIWVKKSLKLFQSKKYYMRINTY